MGAGGLARDDDRARSDVAAVHDERGLAGIRAAHGLHERFGFGPPDVRFLPREPGR
jgi:hypothetical protein